MLNTPHSKYFTFDNIIAIQFPLDFKIIVDNTDQGILILYAEKDKERCYANIPQYADGRLIKHIGILNEETKKYIIKGHLESFTKINFDINNYQYYLIELIND